MSRPEWVTRALEDALAVARGAPSGLADTLYASWHAGLGTSAPALPTGPSSVLELLRRSHAGSERWDSGWVVAAATAATLTVVREGAVREVAPPDYVNTVRPGVPPAPGEAVAIVERSDWLDPSGWWAAASARHGFPETDAVRVYCSAPVAAVAPAIAALTGALDAAGIAWGLKAPPDAAGYHRRDPVVATLARADWARFAPHLGEAGARLAGVLRPELPPLAKPLALGLAVAEDPGGGRSFGELRCGQVAAALTADVLEAADPVEALASALQAAGVDPARPHLLESHDEDPYRL